MRSGVCGGCSRSLVPREGTTRLPITGRPDDVRGGRDHDGTRELHRGGPGPGARFWSIRTSEPDGRPVRPSSPSQALADLVDLFPGFQVEWETHVEDAD